MRSGTVADSDDERASSGSGDNSDRLRASEVETDSGARADRRKRVSRQIYIRAGACRRVREAVLGKALGSPRWRSPRYPYRSIAYSWTYRMRGNPSRVSCHAVSPLHSPVRDV
jgi:hypothetical protein